MRFTKMQGIGNDYVYVNCFDVPFPKDPQALARKMTDRHFGIGGDGLILICPSDNGADARMRMYNVDGSEAEMCGNGVRVFAPDGTAIGHIHLPERCANVCFGGRNRNRLFMAASHSIYALYVNTQGC